jgi:hypothetical protein
MVALVSNMRLCRGMNGIIAPSHELESELVYGGFEAGG